MADYAGKTALITGGSSGFGLTTAQLLVDGGARVLITGRGREALDRAAAQLGSRATAVVGDTASLSDIDELAARAQAELGTLDLLFVNAGITRFVALADMTEAVYDEVFAINAKGTYFIVQRLAPVVRDGGAIVLTTSVADVKGLAGDSAYSASKAAVRSMTRSFARELAARDIWVNAVSPGPIDTGILERALPKAGADAARTRMTGNNPMQRFWRTGRNRPGRRAPGLRRHVHDRIRIRRRWWNLAVVNEEPTRPGTVPDHRDRTAVVTGGSTGIGFATAQLLAERGGRVIITGASSLSPYPTATRPAAAGPLSRRWLWGRPGNGRPPVTPTRSCRAACW